MQYKYLNKLIISCGGTGGHFNPGLSIATSFQQDGGNVCLVIGGKNQQGQVEQATRCGISCQTIRCAPISKNPLKMLRFFTEQLAGIRQCVRFFRKYQPDAVLAMGAYPSIPAAIAAKLTGTPLFLHDGNARVGKSNRFFSHIAAGIALSFPAVNEDALHCPSEVTGLPMRKQLLDDVPIDKADAVKRLNELFHVHFDAEKPIILVFGGSLGALAINENFTLPANHPLLKDVQIIHLFGKGKLDNFQHKYDKFGIQALTLETSNAMQILYTAADLVVCRAGGSTISELALFGRYSILIPFPYAAELHQDDNAALLATTGAARVVKNSDCTPELFQNLVSDFLDNMPQYKADGLQAKKMAMPDAATNVTAMIDRILTVNHAKHS